MNTFDIIIAALLLFGIVRGLMKGFLVETASLIALIGGVYGAIKFSYFIGNYLKNSVSWSEKYITLVAFAATFLVIVIGVSLLGKLFTKIAAFVSLNIINKLLGGVFGGLKIALILSVLFIFFDRMNKTIPFVKQKTLDSSILYVPVKMVAPTIFPSIIKGEEKIENDNKNFIEKVLSN